MHNHFRLVTAATMVGSLTLLAACDTGRTTADSRAASPEPSVTYSHLAVAPSDGALYFAAPADAPGRVTDLVRAKDWATLTRYYDLSLTPRVDVGAMRSGAFFVDESLPANQGPTAMSRYKQPFPPGSRFVEVVAVGDSAITPCIYDLTTVLEIDQGGGMVQRVLRTTKVIRRTEGWQFLPPAPIGEPRTSLPADGAGVAASGRAFPPSAPATDAEWDARGSDAALFFKPELRARVANEVPADGLRNVAALVTTIDKLKPAAAANKGGSHTGMMPWEPAVIYDPTDDELMLSIAGDRLWRSMQIAPADAIESMRAANPNLPATVTYPHIEITRVGVAGSGPRYYAAPPVERVVRLG